MTVLTAQYQFRHGESDIARVSRIRSLSSNYHSMERNEINKGHAVLSGRNGELKSPCEEIVIRNTDRSLRGFLGIHFSLSTR